MRVGSCGPFGVARSCMLPSPCRSRMIIKSITRRRGRARWCLFQVSMCWAPSTPTAAPWGRRRSRRRPSAGWPPPRSPWWLRRPWLIPPPHTPKGATSTGAIQRSTSIRTRRAQPIRRRHRFAGQPRQPVRPKPRCLGAPVTALRIDAQRMPCSAHQHRRDARTTHGPAVRHSHRCLLVADASLGASPAYRLYSRCGRDVQARSSSGNGEAAAAPRDRMASLRQRHARQPPRRCH
jgi:hypothetical protein